MHVCLTICGSCPGWHWGQAWQLLLVWLKNSYSPQLEYSALANIQHTCGGRECERTERHRSTMLKTTIYLVKWLSLQTPYMFNKGMFLGGFLHSDLASLIFFTYIQRTKLLSVPSFFGIKHVSNKKNRDNKSLIHPCGSLDQNIFYTFLDISIRSFQTASYPTCCMWIFKCRCACWL